MRFSSDVWGSGPRDAGITLEGHRSFSASATGGPATIEALAACGRPGCLSNLELKLAIASEAPEGEVTRTDGGGLEFDETSGVDSVGQTTGTATTLAIGASTNGWINTNGDRDWYAITMVAGQSYAFTLTGGSLADPYLELYDSSGQIIGFDDDFGSGINSLLRWTATASGTYYLNAQAYPDSGLTGSYTLTAATSAPASPLDAIDYHYTMPTTSISVWFATTGYTNPSGDAVVRNWTQTEINAVMAALGTYSAITPLTFSIAPSQQAATWIFSLADLPGNTLGYFAVGSQYAAFDPNVADFTAGLVPGGNSWVTVIHEAGHGLGMAHPHDNGAENYGPDNSEVMQGVTDPFNSLGSFGLNQGVFTTMTYNDGWRSSPFGPTPSNLYGGQATPMALDVALMQQRYGVNPITGAGDTTYTLALANSAYRTIWDVSGTDTMSYAGSGNATIDLRAATLLNAIGGGGYVSFVQGVHGGWTIANGVVIENATGGSGNDTLIGNSAANILTGGAGADTMSGGGGDDTYFVDNAGDIVTEAINEGIDTVYASTTFNLSANVENLTLLSSAFEVHGAGNALNNVITGNENTNVIQGLGGDDHLIGNGGNDQLLGGDGDDVLDGGSGSDRMDGGAGNDTIFWDAADQLDFVVGGSGHDILVFTSGSAPTSFNLVNQGFEGAEGRFTDAGSNLWATRTDSYDALWRLDISITIYDNGTREIIDYDQANAVNWASFLTRQDALLRTTDTVLTYDNGDQDTTSFDVDNSVFWTSFVTRTDSLGRTTETLLIHDDGTRDTTNYDADNSQFWTSFVTRRDSLGRTTESLLIHDDGTRDTTNYDADNSQFWTSFVTRRDSLGRQTESLLIHDDGTRDTTNFDPENNVFWSSFVTRRDSLGRTTDTLLIYDDGRRDSTDYDEANAYDWANVVYRYDSGGTLYQTIITYDDGHVVTI